LAELKLRAANTEKDKAALEQQLSQQEVGAAAAAAAGYGLGEGARMQQEVIGAAAAAAAAGEELVLECCIGHWLPHSLGMSELGRRQGGGEGSIQF
jgi:hypothetical protein